MKARTFIRSNAAPFLAFAGLVAGVLLAYPLELPVAGRRVWLVTLVLVGTPVVWRTLRGILRGEMAADVVAMLAVVTAVIMDQPFAGVIVVLMQTGGEALESLTVGRASSALDALMARAPRSALRKRGEDVAVITADDVRVGDLLVVRPGDLVPVDGLLVSDRAHVDESALTGEPLARAKTHGDALMSGGVNTGAAFEMRAERESADSQYARIVELVRQAQEDRPPLVRLADQYAVWFTPLTLIMCAIGWAITGNPQTILAVLVVATPCPLILAVPVAVISAVNRAASENIIVKGGTALEQIGRAEAFVFDKTGTLTVGVPELSEVLSFGDISEAALLHTAASVEQLSSHSLAGALVEAAAPQVGALAFPSEFREIPGRGVEGTLHGEIVLIGSAQLLTERIGHSGPDMPEAPGALVAYVAVAGKAVGLLRFTDHVRTGADDMVRRLREMGAKHVALLTGDSALNADAIGTPLAMDDIRGDLLPEGKVDAVQELMRRFDGVVMVGDGINDAPALAAATVGVAMGARGTGISAQAADIVLLEDDVSKVAEAVVIGRRMLFIARQSIYVGLGLSFGFMVAAAFGKIPPAAGALIQEAIDVAVILNALRARQATPPPGCSRV